MDSAKRQKQRGVHKKTNQVWELVTTTPCDYKGKGDGPNILERDDRFLFRVSFKNERDFLFQELFDKIPIADLVALVQDYFAADAERQVEMRIFVQGEREIPNNYWFPSESIATIFQKFGNIPVQEPQTVAVFEHQRPLTVGSVTLLPWQDAAAQKLFDIYRGCYEIEDPLWKVHEGAGGILYTRGGLISKFATPPPALPGPQLRLPGGFLLEKPGVGKTIAAMSAALKVAADISRRNSPSPYRDGKQILNNTIFLFCPCDVVRSWKQTVQDMCPNNLRLVLLTYELSLNQLETVLSTPHEGVTVLILSFDLLLVGKTTPKPNRYVQTRDDAKNKGTPSNLMNLLRPYRASVTVIDEVHNIFPRGDIPAKFLHRRDQTAINRTPWFLLQYIDALFTILVSATFSFGDDNAVNTCLAMLKAHHSSHGYLFHAPASSPGECHQRGQIHTTHRKTSVANPWTSVPTKPSLKYFRDLFRKVHFVTTGAEHSPKMLQEVIISYKKHPLFNPEILDQTLPLPLSASLQQDLENGYLKEIPYSRNNENAFSYLQRAIEREILEYYTHGVNDNGPNPFFPYKQPLLDLCRNAPPVSTIGNIYPDASQPFPKYTGPHKMLTRQHALISVIMMLQGKPTKSRIVIYDASTNSDVCSTAALLELFKEVKIPCVQLIGNISRVERALNLFQTQESFCIMIIGKNHTEGVNIPELTHVIVMDSTNVNTGALQQLIGRGTRRGRKGQVTVVHLNGV